MKQNYLLASFLSLSSMALPLSAARAATISSAYGDLILGFRVTDGLGQGGNSNLEVDLGSYSQFLNVSTAFTLSGLANADLASAYGADWNTRADLVWGVVGSSSGGLSPALFATSPEASPGAPATPWSRGSAISQRTGSQAITPFYLSSEQGALNGATSTTNSPAAAVINASYAGSWTVQEQRTASESFSYFNPTVENTAQIAAGSSSVSDLYELLPSATGGAGTLLGSFALSSAGALTFHPPSNAAPVYVIGFTVSAPSAAIAGAPFSFTVVAVTGTSPAVPAYSGTVQFVSAGGEIQLPSPEAFASGSLVLTGTALSSGTLSIAAQDPGNPAIAGASAAIVASETPSITGFNVSVPASAVQGQPFTFTVVATGSGALAYSGAVRFSSSDPLAILPPDSALTSGSGKFTATLKTASPETIAVTDNANASIAGRSASISVALPPPPALAAGSYDGVFANANPTNANEGYFSATLDAKARFTGTLSAGGESVALSGSFNSLGQFHKSVARKNERALTISLKENFLTGTIDGTVTDSVFVSTLSASAKTPAGALAGNYTAVFQQDNAGTRFPQGTGYATVKISPAGDVTLSGKLGDGSALSSRTYLKSDGSFAVYSPLYSAVFPGAGSLVGILAVSGSESETDTLHWFKPARPADLIYKQGFATSVSAQTSPFHPPTGGALILAFPAGANNGKITIAGGNIPAAKNISKTATLNAASKVSFPANAATQLSMQINVANGLFTGSFIHPVTTKATPFQGVLFQKQGAGEGFFVGPSASGLVEFEPSK